MNIRANLADVAKRLWQENEELRQDVARIEQIWSERPNMNGFLCGEFSIADAFYAPVVTRLMTYALPVSDSTRQYMQTMLQHPAMQAWIDAALQEDAWVNYLESYQQKPL
jgi:glutathione S-transferase